MGFGYPYKIVSFRTNNRLMSDTDYSIGKETGIFTINIDENGKLQSLEIVPLYINAKKQTVLYKEYNN